MTANELEMDVLGENAQLKARITELESAYSRLLFKWENEESEMFRENTTLTQRVRELEAQLAMAVDFAEGGQMHSLMLRFKSLDTNAKNYILAEIVRMQNATKR